MPRPSRTVEIEDALLRAIEAHPRDLVGMVAAQLGLSTARISIQVRSLVASGYLRKQGSTRPTYTLGENRRLSQRFSRNGLAEDEVWFRFLLPLLQDLPRNVLDIAHHGVTEMINNAVDHSEGEHVSVHMDLDRSKRKLLLWIGDDGIGIFTRISQALQLPDPRLALLELSKGKFTTDPRRHSGEGIFFTSRAFDSFQILSGGLAYDHVEKAGDWLHELDAGWGETGTVVFMEIAIDSTRAIGDVFSAYSSGPDDYDFAKTVVPVRRAKVGDENLVSRSQAKRLLQRIDRFRHVVFDFSEVTTIGQAFADEIFRVFANDHPEVELIAVHALPQVQQMIRRAEVARYEGRGQLPLLS